MKKARGWLDAQGLDHTFRDFKKVPPGEEEVASWADIVGWEVLLNRRGTTFRKLGEADKADLGSDGSRDRAIALMVQHPSLIKRPVLEHEAGLLVGFSEPEWKEKLC